MENKQTEHIPVLADELVEYISLPTDAVMVDATIGQGGHSFLFGSKPGAGGTIIGFDVDEECLNRAENRLSALACKVILVRANFSEIENKLREQKIEKVDFILADLGFCSGQLENIEKGLSFQINMPLDMRLDKRLKTSAADIVNGVDEKTLADLIYKFGEDRASRRIARFIVQQRELERIITTGQLARIVSKALWSLGKKRRSKIHPATRTFQALRIAVNNELENLQVLLDCGPRLLKKNGFIAVISFHSLEDRLVKQSFKQNKKDGIYQLMTKKPIVATKDEKLANPRARSAKLRIAEKIV